MLECFFFLIYPNTRVTIECTELFTEMPSSCQYQPATFSNYNHHNTAKVFAVIALCGAVTFVSDVYADRSTDRPH